MSDSGEPPKIALIGAGNLAWHLGHALVSNGICVSQVISRTALSAALLAKQLNAGGTDNLSHLNKDTDICILCVTDDAITHVLESLDHIDGMLVHTAGSVAMAVMAGHSTHYGVLYPLQTFTLGKPLEFKKIPVLVEGNSTEALEEISRLAGRITSQVIQADSGQRLYLHLAAIFASNFSNHMYALAEKLATDHGLSFALLKPLIEETTAKAIAVSPVKAQTGPAARRNNTILEKHLALLQEQSDLQQLYRLISESIKRMS